jgi:hypothetical protein
MIVYECNDMRSVSRSRPSCVYIYAQLLFRIILYYVRVWRLSCISESIVAAAAGGRGMRDKANNSYAWSTAVCRPRFSRKSPDKELHRTAVTCMFYTCTLQLAHLCDPLQTCSAAETQDAGVTYSRLSGVYDTI